MLRIINAVLKSNILYNAQKALYIRKNSYITFYHIQHIIFHFLGELKNSKISYTINEKE